MSPKRILLVCSLSLCASAAHAGPQEGLALALADARTIGDKDTAYYTRYLDGTHLSPDRLIAYARQCQLQVNLLSRAPRKYKPRLIGNGTMLAVDLRYIAADKDDYQRLFKVWDRFTVREPYYHQRALIEEKALNQYGQQYATGQKKLQTYHAAHLSPSQVNELCGITKAETPIVAMDWFFAMTAVEADRGGIGKGFGYYDFLNIKNRDDYFKLAGVKLDDGRSEQSELLAVVLAHNSGVAQNDRMVVRRAATDGFLWYTMDFFDNNLDERNPLLFLDPKKGIKHQAERHFATLPNGLPVVIACAADGTLQETAPDKIGPDSTARGKDTRIHCAKSCLSCHNNGFLKDINDEVRQIYKFEPNKGYNLLSAPEKEEELRLHDRYLRDFKIKLEADRLAYEVAMREIIGYPPENGEPVKLVIPHAAAEYRDCYQWYILDPLNIDQVAAGIGITTQEFETKLKAYRRADQLASHILAPLSVGRPVTRTNYELLYPLLQQMTRGVPVEVPVKKEKHP